jgi:hypothetical protein
MQPQFPGSQSAFKAVREFRDLAQRISFHRGVPYEQARESEGPGDGDSMVWWHSWALVHRVFLASASWVCLTRGECHHPDGGSDGLRVLR